MSDPFTRLRERKLFQWAAAYLAGAWVAWQALDIFGDRWGIPLRVQRATDVILVAGFLLTLVLAWHHGEKGRQRITGTELLVSAVILSLTGVALLFVDNDVRGATGFPTADSDLVAVLPVATPGDSDLEYLADGLQEGISVELTRAGIPTIHRNSVMPFRGTTRPLPEIAALLGANVIVEGSLSRKLDRLEVEVRVADGATGAYRAAETVSALSSDASRLRFSVAEVVAAVLGRELGPDRSGEARHDVVPEAYEAYLRGRFHPDLERRLEYYQEAIRLDSSYAEPFGGIANVWSNWRQSGIVPPSVATPRIAEALLSALERDNGSAEIHARLGAYRVYTEWDWEGGRSAYERAIELAPGQATGRPTYCHLLFILGRPEEGLEQCELAVRLDPLNPGARAFYGMALVFSGRDAEAAEQFQQILSREPDHSTALSGLWMAMGGLGREGEALEVAARVLEVRGLDRAASLLLDETVGDPPARVAAAADLLAEMSETRYVSPLTIARFYLLSRRPDQAFEWLERAFDQKDPNLPFLGVVPFMRPYRDDPRYRDLARRVGLPLTTDER